MSWLRKLRERTEATVRQLNSKPDSRQQMDEIVTELEQQIAEVQTQLAGYVATANEFRERENEYMALVEKRQGEALAAMQAGKPDLARRILADQAHLENQTEESRRLWQQAQETISHLQRNLDDLQMEQLRLRERRDELVTRADSAELEQHMADLKSGLDGRARSFEQMEEKVQSLEVQAQAHREVANWTEPSKDSQEADVDARLEALRRQLEQGS